MYGFDQNGRLYAVELPSGKRLWDTTEPVSERPASSATAFIVRQGTSGDRYWLFNDSGDLIIAELTPEGLRGDRSGATHRADQHGVRPRRGVVHAGVRQPADVRPQRQRMHLRGAGEVAATSRMH